MKMKVASREMVDDFAEKYNLTANRLIALNGQPGQHLAGKQATDQIEGGWELEIGGRAIAPVVGEDVNEEFLNKLLQGLTLDKIKQLNDRIADKIQECYEAPALPLNKQNTRLNKKRLKNNGLGEIQWLIIPEDQDEDAAFRGEPLPPDGVANPDHLWLTYETQFNVPEYRKGEKTRAVGLYVLPLDERATVVASKRMPDILRETFLPDLSKEEVEALSAANSPWLQQRTKPAPNLSSSPRQLTTRRVAVVNVPPRLVMPYNYLANDKTSCAIGTDLEEIAPRAGGGSPFKPYRLQKRLPLWETASRSSVVKLSATGDSELATKLTENWNLRGVTLETDVDGVPKSFVHGDKTCFSVKSGVCWVGTKYQGTTKSTADAPGKDILEEEALVACMRTEWIDHVNSTKKPEDPKLGILGELLTVTYLNKPAYLKGQVQSDGFQVRDLLPLDADNIYFPPLAIPCAGQAIVDAFHGREATVEEFEAFWEEHYARAIGRAKAELLLRYGVQMQTPNAQNFLLEVDKATMTPTGKVLIRDLGDLLLHSEVIKAIGGDHPVIKYELDNPDNLSYLPIQTSKKGKPAKPDGDVEKDSRFATYPKDTRTQWHNYSTFAPQYGGKYLPRTWLTKIRWGRAHFAAYIGHMHDRLKMPELKLPVFGEEARLRVMAATEPAKSAGELRSNAAQRTLPKAIAKAGGDITQVTVDTYKALAKEGACVENDAYYTEWALELHSNEILHEILIRPETLAEIKKL